MYPNTLYNRDFLALFWFDGKSKEPVKYEGGRDYDSIASL
jgi:hypothetical protein